MTISRDSRSKLMLLVVVCILPLSSTFIVLESLNLTASACEPILPQVRSKLSKEDRAAQRRKEDTIQLMVHVLKRQLEWEKKDRQRYSVYFVATVNDEGKWIDPPSGVIEGLKGVGLKVLPVSKSEHSTKGVKERETGRFSVILDVKIEWIRVGAAKVWESKFCGALCGNGEEYIIERNLRGKWEITKYLGSWDS